MEGSQFGTSGLVAGAAIPGSGTTENAGGEPSSDSITPEESLATSDIPIPAGAIAPAAFYDTDAKTPQQQRALNQIVGNFEKDIAEGAGQGLSETELWEAARRMADERYLTLFGWQAYNARHFQSAKQALAEKRTLQTAQ
jgi:hypothetical protein